MEEKLKDPILEGTPEAVQGSTPEEDVTAGATTSEEPAVATEETTPDVPETASKNYMADEGPEQDDSAATAEETPAATSDDSEGKSDDDGGKGDSENHVPSTTEEPNEEEESACPTDGQPVRMICDKPIKIYRSPSEKSTYILYTGAVDMLPCKEGSAFIPVRYKAKGVGLAKGFIKA